MLKYFGDVRNGRRLALANRITATLAGDVDRSLMWQARQNDWHGALALPVGFPYRTQLAAIGYTAAEDLDGALEDELMEAVSLTRAQAQCVLSALTRL